MIDWASHEVHQAAATVATGIVSVARWLPDAYRNPKPIGYAALLGTMLFGLNSQKIINIGKFFTGLFDFSALILSF